MELKHFALKFFILSLFSAFLVFSRAEDTENEIKLNPDDEDNSSSPTYTSDILKQFLDDLEKRSGLGTTNNTLTIACTAHGQSQCILNYQGNLIWEARAQLYSKHLMQNYNASDPSTLEDRKITIDGCLNFSTTVTGYQDCMAEVRTQMVQYLTNDFDGYIQEKINANCSLFTENCYPTSE